MHGCHANGCESTDTHAEIPFCKGHWRRLPERLRKKLWSKRPSGECGACSPGAAHETWTELYNLAVGILHFLDWGDHDCPDSVRDDKDFCWGCGIQAPDDTFKTAKTVVRKFNCKR